MENKIIKFVSVIDQFGLRDINALSDLGTKEHHVYVHDYSEYMIYKQMVAQESSQEVPYPEVSKLNK